MEFMSFYGQYFCFEIDYVSVRGVSGGDTYCCVLLVSDMMGDQVVEEYSLMGNVIVL